jgi:hypothetical protein
MPHRSRLRLSPGKRSRAFRLGGAFMLTLGLVLAPVVGAREPRAIQAPPRFADGTADILRRRCLRCHGAREPDAELRLDSFAALMRGGEDGPVVVEGDPDASLLYRKIRRIDRPPMPPRVALPARERQTIRAWIAAGALP